MEIIDRWLLEYMTMDKNRKKTAVIVGAGPAGLTAAYELLKTDNVTPVVLEATSAIGGISQTVNFAGNRMDIGGHRFFSKNDKVMSWWREVMPLQAAPALDELLLGAQDSDAQPSPQHADRIMLRRRRVSRIFFLRKFFPYPISLTLATLAKMGLWRTIKAGCGYIAAKMHRLPETSLENFYINRFGKPLYKLFFEDYTHKVWGLHPSRLGADWGSQRVKGLSVSTVLKNAILKPFRSGGMEQKGVETSLIEEFLYPKYGPGQLWECVAADIVKRGGILQKECRVEKVNVENGRVVSVVYSAADGSLHTQECDYLFSSMPLKELVPALQGIQVPQQVAQVAEKLPYRDFITVGLLVDSMKIKNHTKLRTYDSRVPDTWIYIQERDVKVGRLQVFNNWSPYMVADYKNTIFLGLEYFCNEGDELWQMGEQDFISMAIDELEKIDIIDASAVKKAHLVKMKKAYPAYHGSYYNLAVVRDFLGGIDNLYCIGRNGQHRYNNMDHSMLTAFAAVDSIVNGASAQAVWEVNSDDEYHEEK